MIETNFKDNLKCLKRNMNRKFVNKLREMVRKLSDSESEEELLVIPEYDGIEQIHLYYDYDRDYKDELNDAFDDTNIKQQLQIAYAKIEIVKEIISSLKENSNINPRKRSSFIY